MFARSFVIVCLSFTACTLGPSASISSPAQDQSTTAHPLDEGAPTTLSTTPHATLVFDGTWANSQHGALVRGGHVDVTYAASRLSQCAAPTIAKFARFQPGGQMASSDEAFGFDVPQDATSVELWFHAVSPDCDQWDSNYGNNFVFPVIAAASADVGWAGDWGSSTNRNCSHDIGVPEPISIDEYMRERACIFVDLDVWVPGVTDVDAAHPEYLQATVSWKKDGGALVTETLAYQGLEWHNARYRWSIPYEVRSMADWNTVTYSFSVVSDGMTSHRYAQDSGADRTIVRAFSFSSP